ncbi:hydroxymethylglutaryl-CoA lyase [Xanthobacter tagetidis]|uniref:Hydroxymethylglutaryl-CoA lyase n=1 Tax=Xanthobacter tagetidis TaxID=60216 RepID=A0A3L7AFW0_9HYPH|nr:hydroxymethylglutaryl-CoA lyase [Xanthobacter tagetidis]MBB6308597.1 hydroxymethylglutaryl-CoA lyase [Xanthobacter tagetidis]RLP78640.1 hydroxymethylglutaryl-CoA lyase [Xanthobacter tagetidis]
MAAARHITGTPAFVRIVEVGPRDGLQNEPVVLSVAQRAALIADLAQAGLATIEAGSFVSPRWVPQMDGTAEVLQATRDLAGVSLPVLVPNLKGYALARAAGAGCIALFAAATEGFARANLNGGREETFARFAAVARAAVAEGVMVRGYVSCALHCPYEGWVAPEVTADLAYRLMELGCYEVSVCDTTGRGTPERAEAMAQAAIAAISAPSVAVHFHDTGGRALDNTRACLDLGVRTVDSAVAGLGGCPYSPGAAGNLDTGRLVAMLDAEGFRHGVDAARLAATAVQVRTELRAGRPIARANPEKHRTQEGRVPTPARQEGVTP